MSKASIAEVERLQLKEMKEAARVDNAARLAGKRLRKTQLD
jgi:hypothetical protein